MGDPVILFSYGTLRQEEVQRETFGRLLEGTADILSGFRLGTIRIGDPDVVELSGAAEHPILVRTGDPADKVAGVAFRVTPAELAAADAYETDDYARVRVTLESGLEAFVYVAL